MPISVVSLMQALMLVASVCSFQPVSFVPRTDPRLYSTGKGFGAPPPPPKKAKGEENEKSEAPAVIQEAPITAGQKTLMEMRRQRAEEKDEELRKVKELREMDKAIQEAPAAIPEKVANRMGQRMLTFVGVPLFLGLGSFVVFWYLYTYKDLEVQPLTVAVTTIGLLVVGLLGITYSIFSTSWDEDREGGALGIEEAQRNLGNIREGLGRTRDNAIVRENMAGLSEREIDRAISDLDRRDSKKAEKGE